MHLLSVLALLCSVLPAALFLVNLRRYRPPAAVADPEPSPVVAVLIPARDEERNIALCLEHVLRSTHANLEVMVLDDASQDRTNEIVTGIMATDSRVRLVQGLSLPHGWNGKQHACWRLAEQTTAPLLLFLDADVRLAPEAIGCCIASLNVSWKGLPSPALLSGFPRQITRGVLEQLLLPLIHFVLLAFLPMGSMRRGTHPGFSAGCGQFFLVRREAYLAVGGHAAIRQTRHDGLRLPQLFRRAGFRTELVDLTALAEVRMYDSSRAVWEGLAKNATEGLAAPSRILPLSLLLLLGQVIPVFLALRAVHSPLGRGTSLLIGGALLASFLPRLLAVRRFRQPLLSALAHPAGIALLLILQWYALFRQVLGRPVDWRHRSYSSQTGAEL